MNKQAELHMKSRVAVVTTTVGRNTLEQAIRSIQQQTYPCQHYIFIDGKQFWEQVKAQELEQRYPDVTFVFLPMNTGGKDHVGNGAIHAIAPYLLQEEIICFLDDDNWHSPDHVEHLVRLIEQCGLDYAYSLRKLYDSQYQYICDDNIESLGFWSFTHDYLIDTNSYALTRKIAFQVAEQWHSGIINDRNVFKKLIELKAKGGCTGKRTTHYKFNMENNPHYSEQELIALLRAQNQHVETHVNMAWLTPTLLIDGQLFVMSSENQTNTVLKYPI